MSSEKIQRKKIVLFVDDEPLFLESMARMLRRKEDQWQLLFCQGVDEALSMIWKNPVDVIISDVNMPGKSGFDLLSALQEQEATRATLVIILTGSGEHDLKKRALAAGATDLLNKPVQYEELVARIASVLRIRAYQEKIEDEKILLESRVRARTAELEFLHYDILWRLAKAGELRDEETGNHVVRVAHYSRILAQRCDLSSTEVEWIFMTAPLHDLGKIGISDAILLKPGPLDAEEWRLMQGHCQIGHAILMDEPHGLCDAAHSPLATGSCLSKKHTLDGMRQMAGQITLHHHEKWDGSGYPQGLQGEDISLAGRIVAIADVFDALCSERPYKEAMTVAQAQTVIREGSGSHFDPQLVEIFFHCQDEVGRIYKYYSSS